MIIRLLLILSLIFQLVLTFECGSISVILPTLFCVDDDPCIVIGVPVSASACGANVARGCDTKTIPTGPACPTSPCSDTDAPLDDSENPCDPDDPCRDGECPTCPPPLPDKVPDGKPVQLFLPLLLAVIDLSVTQIEATRPDTSFIEPKRWVDHHTRQARLGTWLN